MNNSSSYQGPGKTTVSILNEINYILLVDAYSSEGFRLNNRMKVFGPMAILPTSVLGWFVPNGIEDISAESLTLFSLLNPRPDVVVVGIGDSNARLSKKQIMELRGTGLNVEMLTTENAIATYNYLATEGRVVGAALIPPSNVRRLSDDDYMDWRKSLYAGDPWGDFDLENNDIMGHKRATKYIQEARKEAQRINDERDKDK